MLCCLFVGFVLLCLGLLFRWFLLAFGFLCFFFCCFAVVFRFVWWRGRGASFSFRVGCGIGKVRLSHLIGDWDTKELVAVA